MNRLLKRIIIVGCLIGVQVMRAGTALPPVSREWRLYGQHQSIIQPVLLKASRFADQVEGRRAHTRFNWSAIERLMAMEFFILTPGVFQAQTRTAAVVQLQRVRDFLLETQYARLARDAYGVVDAFCRNQLSAEFAAHRLQGLVRTLVVRRDGMLMRP